MGEEGPALASQQLEVMKLLHRDVEVIETKGEQCSKSRGTMQNLSWMRPTKGNCSSAASPFVIIRLLLRRLWTTSDVRRRGGQLGEGLHSS